MTHKLRYEKRRKAEGIVTPSILLVVSMIMMIFCSLKYDTFLRVHTAITRHGTFEHILRKSFYSSKLLYSRAIYKNTISEQELIQRKALLQSIEGQISTKQRYLQTLNKVSMLPKEYTSHKGTFVIGQILRLTTEEAIHSAIISILVPSKNGINLIQENDLVISGSAVIGRVYSIDKKHKIILVMPIEHFKSRIPVELPQSGISGIAYGEGSSLSLRYTRGGKAPPQEGEPVLTSGQYSLVGAGFKVGSIAKPSKQESKDDKTHPVIHTATEKTDLFLIILASKPFQGSAEQPQQQTSKQTLPTEQKAKSKQKEPQKQIKGKAKSPTMKARPPTKAQV